MDGSFTDLCLDADDPALVGRFWADLLGHEVEDLPDGNVRVVGPGFPHVLWIDQVPEPKVTKNRVHPDLAIPELGAVIDLGATVIDEQRFHSGAHDRTYHWWVLADPEGNELCAFDDEIPGTPQTSEAPGSVFALCVDSAQPEPLAAWWQDLLGGKLLPAPDGTPRWIEHARGFDHVILKFIRVDDERIAKNRSHWDTAFPGRHADVVDQLLRRGADLKRPPTAEDDWTVLTDPDGNEFCVFTPEDPPERA